MKKMLLTLTVALLSGIVTVNAQNVNIPDANFKAYLLGESAINTNGDTEIQVSEAIAFTGTIDCAGVGIYSLTGIEAFTVLTILLCHQNQLTTLDLSSNTALTKLSCFSNALTTLNVSNNTDLTNLDLSFNYLTLLDVSNNTALTNLICRNNQLTNLNVSNNAALYVLSCDNNQLSVLNVKNGNNGNLTDFYALSNPNLTCIQVDNAAYSSANWTNIDAITSFSENCSLSTGIDYHSLNNVIKVYPNPTTGSVFLSENYNVTLTNLTGKIIVQQQNTKAIDISNQSTGVYFILITDNKGQIVQRIKVTKE